MAAALIVPYGVDRLPTSIDANIAAVTTTGVPFVAVEPGTAATLRLNTVPWHRAARTQGSVAAGDPFDVLCRHLFDLCGPWAKRPRAFIERYFAAIAAHVDRHREELSARLAPFDGLYRVEDWRYAAPAPLPRALLPVPGQAEPVQVDIAFLLAGKWFAVECGTSGLLPAQARRRAQRLDEAGIVRVAFTGSDRHEGDGALLERVLGADLAYWRNEPLPAGPFRPDLQDHI